MNAATLTPIDAQTLAARLKSGAVTIVDIREADEYAREHIAGAVSLPLSGLERGRVNLEPTGQVVFHCRSGMRTNSNCARLAEHVEGHAYMLSGGLEAWKSAGLSIDSDRSAPLEMNRQVQISAGSLILLGVLATAFVHPLFVLVPAAIGAGLMFAGVSGWCGMAQVLAAMPWNRRAAP
jgi:rhodanese-related sulfurtransferase